MTTATISPIITSPKNNNEAESVAEQLLRVAEARF
jgi:hypothetical protein